MKTSHNSLKYCLMSFNFQKHDGALSQLVAAVVLLSIWNKTVQQKGTVESQD